MASGSGGRAASAILGNRDHSDSTARPGFGSLLERLASDGMRWGEAELALASAELGDLRRRCAKAAILASIAAAALLCAVFILAQAGVAAAALYLDSDIAAGIAVGGLLLAVAGMCAAAIGRKFSWRAESLLFGWLTPAASRKRVPR